jgi:hypothetical protein
MSRLAPMAPSSSASARAPGAQAAPAAARSTRSSARLSPPMHPGSPSAAATGSAGLSPVLPLAARAVPASSAALNATVPVSRKRKADDPTAAASSPSDDAATAAKKARPSGPPPTPAVFQSLLSPLRRVAVGNNEGVHAGADGVFGSPMALHPPPKHPQIQQNARDLGGNILSTFMSMQPTDRKAQLSQLHTVATQSGELAFDAGHISAKHERLVNNFTGHPTGDEFRKIYAGQDEATQSQTSAHFISGMVNLRPPPNAVWTQSMLDEGKAFIQHSALLLSSLRIPTSEVSAPVRVNGELMGQRHPTGDMPKIAHGGSAHSLDDRTRADTWTTISKAALASHGPAHAVMAGGAAAGAYTLHHMSLPHTGSNVAGDIYSQAQRDKQFDGRAALKAQTQLLLAEFGAQPDTRMQAASAPALPLVYPLSPPRQRMAQPAATPPSLAI